MNPFIAFKAVAVLAAAVILGISVALPSSSGVTLKRIHDPRRVTYSIHLRSCHVRHGGRLPDRSCTPGSVDPAVKQANIRSTICRAGWTKKVRPSSWRTEWAKYRVAYPAYHLRGGVRSELDHLVPLELGGSNDITNLWPENYRGFLNADDKDRLENYLHDAVCSGRMPLQAAQETIATDWVKAYCAARLGECPAGLR
jgi:5-methylcytosine-specific restriction endonuclease McrA